jgi:hypothetical protein
MEFGSKEMKDTWIPGLSSGDIIGCFGLTEPNAGSGILFKKILVVWRREQLIKEITIFSMAPKPGLLILLSLIFLLSGPRMIMMI